MKFSYTGRTMHNKHVNGVVEANTKKGAIMQLKKQKIIVIKIDEYKEKKDLKFFISKLTVLKKEPKEKGNEKSKPEYLKKITNSLQFLKRKQNIINININTEDSNTNEKNEDKSKYTFNEINYALKRDDVISNIKQETKKVVVEELNDIDVDAIMNTDFRNGLSTFKKKKDKKPSLLTAEFDIETLKKILNSDIGGSGKKNAGVKKKKSKKVSSKELLMFCKKLSTLLETGVPITRCLQILMEQTENAYFQKILAVVTKDIAHGTSLSESMRKFPNVFSPHFTALVKTGEDTGELSTTFTLLYDEILNSTKIKSKVKGAAMYPCVILGVLFLAFIIAAKILVPMFTDLFDGMGLPKFTEIVFNFLSFFDKNLVWIIASIFIGVNILNLALRNITIRYRFDVFKLKLPKIGLIMTEYHIINILRTMDISLKNGLSMPDSLELAIETTENIALKFELQKVLNKVVQGISLSIAMKESPVFPSLCVQMLKIGEESGRMEDLIVKTLEFYEWELNDFLDKSSKLIEPFAILLVAVFVVCFVFAVAIPMFDLSSGQMLE